MHRAVPEKWGPPRQGPRSRASSDTELGFIYVALPSKELDLRYRASSGTEIGPRSRAFPGWA